MTYEETDYIIYFLCYTLELLNNIFSWAYANIKILIAADIY